MAFGVFLIFSTLNTPLFYPLLFTVSIINLLLIKYSILSYSKIYIENNNILLTNLLKQKRTLPISDKTLAFHVLGGTFRIPQNTVLIRRKNKNLIRIRLNDTEWEFERFLHYTKQYNAQWVFHESRKKSHDKKYKMYLSKLEIQQKNKSH